MEGPLSARRCVPKIRCRWEAVFSRKHPRRPDPDTNRPRFPGAGSGRFQWWTRSERIRTVSEVALSFSFTSAEVATYQRIARDVERLRALGLSLNRIAEHLGVDDKTVARALGWIRNPAD